MKHKHWLQGGLIAFIGFMLSPLSWWNDAFVNFPLAIGFGWLVALAYKPAFEPAVVFGYWLTNVLGLVLMHKGAQRALRPEQRQSYTSKSLLRDVAISLTLPHPTTLGNPWHRFLQNYSYSLSGTKDIPHPS